jgi:hypothetical protein
MCLLFRKILFLRINLGFAPRANNCKLPQKLVLAHPNRRLISELTVEPNLELVVGQLVGQL